MTRNLKALGLALVAALAMSAVAASTASAIFHSEAGETRLTESASETQVFSYTGATKLTCNTVTLDNSVQKTSTASTLEVTPTYSGDCTGPLGIATTIDMNDCTYLFTVEGVEANTTTGPAPHVTCPAGKEITITVGELCTFHIPAQTPDGDVHYSNIGAGNTREITVTPTVSGIDGTRTGSALCGAATSTTGTYTGDVSVTGEDPISNAHIGIWVDD